MSCKNCGYDEFAHSLKNAPTCAKYEADPTEGWRKIERHPLLCDICRRIATWSHPAGGLRCDNCPRPNR